MDKQSKRQTIQAKVKPALVRLDLPGRNFWHARIESERAFDPFRYSQQTEVLPIGTDNLNAQRQPVFAETRRQRYRGRAEQGELPLRSTTERSTAQAEGPPEFASVNGENDRLGF